MFIKILICLFFCMLILKMSSRYVWIKIYFNILIYEFYYLIKIVLLFDNVFMNISCRLLDKNY